MRHFGVLLSLLRFSSVDMFPCTCEKPLRNKARPSKQDVILCLTRKPAEEIVAKEMGVVMEGDGAAPSINFHPFVVTADGNSVKDRDARIGGRLNET